VYAHAHAHARTRARMNPRARFLKKKVSSRFSLLEETSVSRCAARLGTIDADSIGRSNGRSSTLEYSPLGVGEESAGCPPLTITLSLTSSWMSWSSMSRSGVAPPTASPQHQLQANKNWSVGMYRKAPMGVESLVSNWLSARGARGRAFPCDRDFTRRRGEARRADRGVDTLGFLAPHTARTFLTYLAAISQISRACTRDATMSRRYQSPTPPPPPLNRRFRSD
jgi:hypothetical protein